jgi:epoxyqueuosine reductase QueG
LKESIPSANPRELTDSVIRTASHLGAVETGIAPAERFRKDDVSTIDDGCSYPSTGYAPEELLPGARSVLVVAARIPNGVLKSNLMPLDTTYAFGTFAYVHLNRLLNSITYEIARLLEDSGYSSLPLGACGAARCHRQSYEKGSTAGPLHGIFNLKRAAVLAGIGRRTRSGLVATAHHGTRVRLGAVITTADLIANPVMKGTPCPPHCRICADACPMKAITTEGHVNHVRCFSDEGRRGTTEPEILNEMTRAFPLVDAESGYLVHEHAAIDGFGNRVCRVACMAHCPLWKAE